MNFIGGFFVLLILAITVLIILDLAGVINFNTLFSSHTSSAPYSSSSSSPGSSSGSSGSSSGSPAPAPADTTLPIAPASSSSSSSATSPSSTSSSSSSSASPVTGSWFCAWGMSGPNANVGTPIRTYGSGFQCMATDGKNCMWTNSKATCISNANNPPSGLTPLFSDGGWGLQPITSA